MPLSKPPKNPVRLVRHRVRTPYGDSKGIKGQVPAAIKLLLGEKAARNRDSRMAEAIGQSVNDYQHAASKTFLRLQRVRSDSRRASPASIHDAEASYNASLIRLNDRKNELGKRALSSKRRDNYVKLAASDFVPHQRVSSMRTQARAIAKELLDGYLTNERSDLLITRILRKHAYFFTRGGKTFLEERLRAEQQRYENGNDFRYADNMGKLLEKIRRLKSPSHPVPPAAKS